MARLSIEDEGKIWSSLDDNLRNKIRRGELTFEEAASFVVPIGDLEQKRAKGTTMPGLDSQPAASTEEYDSGTAVETGLIRGGQAIDTLQLGGGLEVADSVNRAADIAGGKAPVVGGFNLTKRIEENRGKPVGEALLNIGKGMILDPLTGAAEAVAAARFGEDALRQRTDTAMNFSREQMQELAITRDKLAGLPQNKVSSDFITAFDNGDYGTALKNLPAAAYYTTLEQLPTLGVQAVATGTTALITRNPAATAIAARTAGGIGGFSEIGSDMESILQEMTPEERDDPQKLLEAFRLATKASTVRAAVEAVAPGSGLGKSLTTRVATLTAAQMASEAGGEAAAAAVMGQERSAGELALEALASGPLSVVAESGGILRSDAAERQAALQAREQEISEFRTLQQNADQAIADLAGVAQEAEAFDPEAEAEAAINELRGEPTQLELPIGSDMTADPEANDRTPTIVDMFSGESVAAPKIVAQQQAAEQAAAEGRMPEETDEAFEIRKQRETDARNKIDERKQSDFEAEKQMAERRKRQRAEDQTTLSQEKSLLSKSDINTEAKRLLQVEAEGLRKTRRGVIKDPKKLDAVVKAYERQRLPELVENVRTRRTEQVTKAREREMAMEDIEVQNELARRQDAKRPKEATVETAPATDLFGDQPGERLFDSPVQPASPKFTGTLTEKQAQKELAAGQLQRQKLTEKITPESKAARAAELAAEVPTVEAAISEQIQKKATAEASKYASAEKKALNAITQQELTNQGKKDISEVKSKIVERMADWRKANPRPKSAPAPVVDDLVKKASTIAKAKETAQKTKQTLTDKKELKAEIDKGATPEQAAEIVRNRRLTPKEDADLRTELGGTPTTANPKITEEIVEIGKRKFRRRESSDVRAALDSIVRSRSRTKLAELLDAVADSDDSTMAEKWLAKRLSGLARNLGLSVTTDTPQDVSETWIGAFMPERNEVWIRDASAETVLHEALHAVTSNLLSSSLAKTNPIIRRAAERLEEARKMAQEVFDAAPDLVEDRVSFARLNNLSSGPLSNLTEFVSYGLTDAGVRDWLNTIKIPGEKLTIWGKFKQAIISMFTPRNPEQRTLLDDIIEATNDLIEVQEKSPGLNAWATGKARQRAGLGFTKVNPSVAAGADFSDPTTKRSLFQLGNGTVNVKFRPEWRSNPVGVLMDALTGGGGYSSVTTEVFERSQSSTAALILRAEQLFKSIDFNLEKQALKSKKDMTEYRAGFTAEIVKFEAMADGLGKTQQAKQMTDKYGQAANAYFAMRETMDGLSRDILSQRLADPRPFTEEEAGIYRSVKENVGTYYTRVYAANTKGLGAERAKKLWKEYSRFASGDKNKEFLDGYEIVRNAAVFVRDNLLTIPDADKLAEMPLAKLQKLADAWGVMPLTGADMDNPINGEIRRDALIAGLQEFADATPQAKDKRAISLVEDILFSKENATLTNYYRGAKQDRTIVTERERVPVEIRKLLGEYEDLPLRAMITITRQAEFRARNKAFNELLAEESGTRILDNEAFVEQGLSTQDWTKLNGVSYGSLDGLWVRNDLARKIEDSAEVQRTFDQVLAMAESRPLETVAFFGRQALTGWAKAAGFIKAIQLVYNMGNMLFNFMGGPLIQLSNGNINPKHTTRAFATAKALIDGAAMQGGNLTPDMEKVVRAGITDSAFMGEIRAVELENLRQLTLDALRSPIEKRVAGGRELLKRGSRAWRETYAMADVVWKIANFYAEEQKLNDFYKAEGVEVSPEMVEREAAKRTNVSNFSYKRVPNLFKIAEKSGLTYIMPYIYETFRAPAGSFLLGLGDIARAKEATTTKGKAIMLASGSKRLVGSTLAMGVIQQMTFALVKQLFGVDDEEEENVEKWKEVLPDYKQNSDYLYMGQTADGKPVLFEFSRLDPMGPATEFYRLLLKGAEPEEYGDTAKKLIIGNPYGIGILKAMFGNSSTNTRMEYMNPQAYELLTDLGDAAQGIPGVNLVVPKGEKLAKMVDQLLPSQLVRMFDERNEGPEGDEMAYIMGKMGIQMHQVDPALTTQFAVTGFTMQKRELQGDFYNFLKNQNKLSDEELLSEFIDLRDREAENFREVTDLYQGMLGMGYTPQQALGLMKKKGLTDAELVQVYTGYRPERSAIVSYSGLEQSFTKAMANDNMSDQVKRQYLTNIRRVLRLAGEGQVPIKE